MGIPSGRPSTNRNTAHTRTRDDSDEFAQHDHATVKEQIPDASLSRSDENSTLTINVMGRSSMLRKISAETISSVAPAENLK